MDNSVNNPDEQNQQQCNEWRDTLNNLKDLHAAYLQAYTECESNKDFAPLKAEKDKLKSQIRLANDTVDVYGLKFIKSIEKLGLTEREVNLLKFMIRRKKYQEAVDTARELKPNIVVPSRNDIIKRLLAQDPEKIRNIVKVMSKPRIIIIPDATFHELVDTINKNPKIDGQQNWQIEADDFVWGLSQSLVRVCVIDMQQSPPTVPGQNPHKTTNREQLDICTQYYREKGLDLIQARQYLVAMHHSLRAYKEFKDRSGLKDLGVILDNDRSLKRSHTLFNQSHVPDPLFVLFGKLTGGMQPYIEEASGADKHVFLCGRASLEIM